MSFRLSVFFLEALQVLEPSLKLAHRNQERIRRPNVTPTFYPSRPQFLESFTLRRLVHVVPDASKAVPTKMHFALAVPPEHARR